MRPRGFGERQTQHGLHKQGGEADMDFLRQLYEQLANIWKSLNLQQRILTGVAFTVILIGLLLLSMWRSSPAYTVLFANLQPSDAAEVIDQLKSTNIPYRLDPEGTTILVPDNRVAETRLTLAQEGLPRGGGVGYEIFDRSRLGITSFEQKVNLKRATEGELSRTINQLNEVQWSRVQIVMPEDRLFTEQQLEPTASVFLNLSTGGILKPKQVQAVQHLVASSIEGMEPENVTILDQHANALTMRSGAELEATELSASQFQLRSHVEKHFQKKVQSMFDRIVGKNRSVVSVSVDLDFDKIEQTEEKYDPDGAVVRSEERQKESTTNPAGGPEGIAGISANLPTATPLATASIGGSQRESSSSITNYEISKTIAHIIRSPSTIKAISASVVVDGTYKRVTDDQGETRREYVPRSEEDIEKYKRLVLASLGNPATRVAEVINVPLDASTADWERIDAAKAREQRDVYFAVGKGAITIVILLFIFLVVRYILRHALPERMKLPEESELAAHLIAKKKAGEDIDAMSEVRDLAADRPNDLASLIKVWVKEEE
jgi:flagellar M-ring protein FliF